MAAIIFANCAVLDGTSRKRREDHHVLVEGDCIREVADRPITSAAAETIDLAGRTLMPGLIDAHVHVLAVDAALARLSDRPVTLLTLPAAKGVLRSRASPTVLRNVAARRATSCAKGQRRSRSWPRAASPRPTTRSGTCNTAKRRCARSSRRHKPGTPM